MRLIPEQVQIILETVHSRLGSDVRTTLFGLRIDDTARGGDIELFIETPRIIDNRAAIASRIAAQLQMRLGDQRIDTVLADRSTQPLWVHEIARRMGVPL